MDKNYKEQPNHELNEEYRKLNAYNEEFATENAEMDINFSGHATSGAIIFGLIGLAATIFALFNDSFTFSIVGILLGFYARAKGARALAIATICLGLLAVILQMFYNGPFISLF